MEGQSSKVGKDVELLRVNDKPHDRYRVHHPQTGERLDNGIPILKRVSGGSVVSKQVTYFTVKCPECHVSAKYTTDSEPVCPECGIICSGEDTILSEQIVRDAKAAERIEGDVNESSA